MKISIISASHRANSESKKISDHLKKNLCNQNKNLDIFFL